MSSGFGGTAETLLMVVLVVVPLVLTMAVTMLLLGTSSILSKYSKSLARQSCIGITGSETISETTFGGVDSVVEAVVDDAVVDVADVVGNAVEIFIPPVSWKLDIDRVDRDSILVNRGLPVLISISRFDRSIFFFPRGVTQKTSPTSITGTHTYYQVLVY